MSRTSKSILLIGLGLVAAGCMALGSTPSKVRFAISEPPGGPGGVAIDEAAHEVLNPATELKTVGALSSYDYDSFSLLKYSNTTLRGYIDHLNDSYSTEQPAEAIYRNYVLNVDLLKGTASYTLERDLLQRNGTSWGVGSDGMYTCTQNNIQIPSDIQTSLASLLPQLALCEGKKTGGGFSVTPLNGATDIETGEPHLLSLQNRGTQILVHDFEGNYYPGYKHRFICAVDAKRALAQKMAELFTPLVSNNCSVPDLAIQFVTDPYIP